MINRIREVRKAKGWTLADLAAACDPPTTAQTIGRLETGTRTLSIDWMDRIGAALGLDPQVLVRSEQTPRAQVVAQLDAGEARALKTPREAILPTEIAPGAAHDAEHPAMIVLEVTAPAGEYRAGDTLWLRRWEAGADGDADGGAFEDAIARAINRDCLVPRPGGRFAFGRLIDRDGSRVGILPAQSGHKQQVIDAPAWIAVAAMLVRPL